MRLLVVGHPLTIAWNQRKYVAMKRADPALRLRVVVPKQIHHTFGIYPCETHPGLEPSEVHPLASAFSRSHMTRILNPVGLAKILREFRPDVIHIEEEPHAMMAVWTIGLRAAICPQAAVTLFTWDNLHRRHRFPLAALKNKLRSYSLQRPARGHLSAGGCHAVHLGQSPPAAQISLGRLEEQAALVQFAACRSGGLRKLRCRASSPQE